MTPCAPTVRARSGPENVAGVRSESFVTSAAPRRNVSNRSGFEPGVTSRVRIPRQHGGVALQIIDMRIAEGVVRALPMPGRDLVVARIEITVVGRTIRMFRRCLLQEQQRARWRE